MSSEKNSTSPDAAASDSRTLAQVQAENEELKRQLASQAPQETASTGSSGEHTWRKIIAGVLAALAIVSLVAAFSVVWLKTTLGDEDQFVATLEELQRHSQNSCHQCEMISLRHRTPLK